MNYPPVPYPSILQGKSECHSDSTLTSTDTLACASVPYSPGRASLDSSASPGLSIPLLPGFHDQITATSIRHPSNGTRSTRVQCVTPHSESDLQLPSAHKTSQHATLPSSQIDSQVVPLAPPAPILSFSELSVARINVESCENTPPSSAWSSPCTPFETPQHIEYPTVHTTDPDLWPIRGMQDGVHPSERDLSGGVRKEDALIRGKHASDSIPATPPVEKRQKVSLHKSSNVSSTHLTTPTSSTSQYQKLSQPFRSPLVHSKNSKQRVPSKSSALTSSLQLTVPPNPANVSTISSQASLELAPPVSTRLNAANDSISQKPVSKPFKSPLLSRSSGKSTTVSVSGDPSALETRKIQVLEKKAIILRQAKKIRLAGTTERVEEDMMKWRSAARGAAEELWSISHSNTMGGILESPSIGSTWTHGSIEEDDDILQEFKNGFEKSWGWATDSRKENEDEDPGDDNERFENDLAGWEPPSPSSLIRDLASRGSKREHADRDLGAPSAKAYSYSCGKDTEAERELKPQEWNIGSMLVSLGIDPKGTLGWDDEEGGFADGD